MQQLFRLLIFLIQPYMFRATNSPILRSTFWLYIQLLVQWADTIADRQQCRCIVSKAVYTVKKCSWGWVNLSPETCRAELKRLINEKSCCILLVIYIVVLKRCTVTQTSNSCIHLFKARRTKMFHCMCWSLALGQRQSLSRELRLDPK